MDERSPASLRALELANNESAVVPVFWPHEIINGLLSAERKMRVTEADNLKFLALLSDMPIAVDQSDPKPFAGLLSIARAHSLSSYDAAYLELAARLGAPLATLDRKLITAARASGVRVV